MRHMQGATHGEVTDHHDAATGSAAARYGSCEQADGAWVALAGTDEVAPGEVIEAQLGSAEVVVWRTESGIPCVMEARCPHQWSHLGSVGAVSGEEIACLTHFWTFATDGSGWKENLDGRRDRKGDIEVYLCREAAGEILVRRDPVRGKP